MLTGKNIIGGSFTGEGKIIFHAENPATGLKLEPGFHEASEKEIWMAIERAAATFDEYRNN